MPSRPSKVKVSDNDPEIIDNLGDEDLPQQLVYEITSYGADYPVDSLVKRLEQGDIFVPPFQRQFVWTLRQSSRFIESLLMGLPVPGIFLSREQESKKLLVIDGQQRLLTLMYFYTGIFADSGKEFALRGVQARFKNLTHKKLSEEDVRRLNDSIIHATVIQQDEPTDDDSSIYHIFERLNTGGTLLMPQEIRACIYHGSFNTLLEELNSNDAWRTIFGQESKRMRDIELIISFLELNLMNDKYEPPMNEFLNRFMKRHRNVEPAANKKFRRAFSSAIETIFESLGRHAFRPRKTLNAAVFDSVMVGVLRRLERGPVTSKSGISQAYEKLINDADFFTSTEQGTAREESIKTRMNLAGT